MTDGAVNRVFDPKIARLGSLQDSWGRDLNLILVSHGGAQGGEGSGGKVGKFGAGKQLHSVVQLHMDLLNIINPSSD